MIKSKKKQKKKRSSKINKNNDSRINKKLLTKINKKHYTSKQSKKFINESGLNLQQKSDTNKQHNMSKCSPNANINKITKSCFDRDSLIRIANEWNKIHSNKINTSFSDAQLWTVINKKMDSQCRDRDEICWINAVNDSKLKTQLKEKFKPKMPTKWKKKPNEWLTTTDIRKVMKQYDKKYNNFVFIGPVPIDFDKKVNDLGSCIVSELCNISVEKLLDKNINKLGVIFNTDPHDKPGEHWISLFADFYSGIYYFDSYGLKPPKEVKLFMERLKQQCNANPKIKQHIETYYNDIRHQYKNSECGIYSINFIVQFLEGKKFIDVINNMVRDDEMHKNRYVYYRQ